MYTITQEQANALYEFAKNKIIKGEKFNKLLAEIAMHVQTKGDRIRSMTDEELAKYIDKHMPKYWCKDGCPASEFCRDSDEATCKETIFKWLKQEAKSND